MNKPVIGLTGPTGAGKSTVAQALKDLGCMVIDADRIAHEVVNQPECASELAREFGSDLIFPDGSLNRKLLGIRAFSTRQKTDRLNEITHPRILGEVLRQIEAGKAGSAKAVILDAPLLFESEADRFCDAVIAVTAPADVRLGRIMQRDSIPAQLAQARIRAQHDEMYYKERAKYSFDGSLPIHLIPESARNLLEKIFGDLHETI